MSGITYSRSMQQDTEACSSYNKLKKRHMLVYAGIVITGIIVIALSFYFFKPATFTHPAYDDNAVAGMPSLDQDKFGYSELVVAEDYKVNICGLPSNDGENIDFYLTNPESNDVWFRAEITDEKNNVLGSTGVIKQGKYVQTVKLDKPLEDRETPVSVKIIGYEPRTWISKGSFAMNLVIYKDYQ